MSKKTERHTQKLTQPALRPTGRLLAVMRYWSQRAAVGGVKKQAPPFEPSFLTP
ncbi:hypothetical protein [Acetobacter orientalis]|uniref:hypothetical protein n=1 Tax=Acetobacter orientalis TaxID=146474 RepID=UPI0015D80411|nr:hypothetical protein [Acetobacter orientalis]